jgi:hypothetical protein
MSKRAPVPEKRYGVMTKREAICATLNKIIARAEEMGNQEIVWLARLALESAQKMEKRLRLYHDSIEAMGFKRCQTDTMKSTNKPETPTV